MKTVQANRGHGSPHDRGRADRYYGARFPIPHCYMNSAYVGEAEMTSNQVREYEDGFWEETDRKDWGSAHITPESAEA